jgi:archaellin
MIMPEIGAPGMIAFTTPASYTDTVYDLQWGGW